MSEPNPEERRRCAELCARVNAAPYYQRLGMTASSARPGTVEVSLPFDERNTQLYGGVHGGALMSLADAALNLALATTFEGHEVTATVEVSMQFLAPVGRRDVVAVGTLTRRGARLAFCDCLISAGGETVARAQGICYVSDPSSRGATKP